MKGRGIVGMKDPEFWEEQRKLMVEEQIRQRGITDPAVLEAMLKVPRHLFVPRDLRMFSYEDRPLPIGEGQTISQPYIVAYMIDALEPKDSDRVLEIGTGSGYAAAVLSRVVKEVYTIERVERLAQKAGQVLKQLGYDNIVTRTGDGSLGWPEAAPFDGIIVSAGAPVVPDALAEQLAPGGRLVIPVGDRVYQNLVRVRRKDNGELVQEYLAGVCFVPLIGEQGWKRPD